MIFIRNERLRVYISLYPITSIIILVQTAVMVLSLMIGLFSFPDIFFLIGGIIKERIVAGEFYRLITYAWIHNGLEHFLLNTLFIYIFAPPLERMLGKWRYILFYLISVLIASLFIVLFSGNNAVGASGFGYGILGLYLYLVWFKPAYIDPSSRSAILILIVIGWGATFLYPNISVLGHLGGFVAGISTGTLMGKSIRRTFY